MTKLIYEIINIKTNKIEDDYILLPSGNIAYVQNDYIVEVEGDYEDDWSQDYRVYWRIESNV